MRVLIHGINYFPELTGIGKYTGEMAFSLADIIFRRTDIATGGSPGESALNSCAKLMAETLGWSTEKVATELAMVRKRFPVYRSTFPS